MTATRRARILSASQTRRLNLARSATGLGVSWRFIVVFSIDFLYAVCMRNPKSSRLSAHKKQRKKMGRPATGHDPSVSVRIPAEILDQVAAWAQRYGCSRSTAIVVMIERGLTVPNGGPKK